MSADETAKAFALVAEKLKESEKKIEVEKKLDNITQRLGVISKSLDPLAQDSGAMSKSLNQLKLDSAAISKSLDELKQGNDVICKSLDMLKQASAAELKESKLQFTMNYTQQIAQRYSQHRSGYHLVGNYFVQDTLMLFRQNRVQWLPEQMNEKERKAYVDALFWYLGHHPSVQYADKEKNTTFHTCNVLHTS